MTCDHVTNYVLDGMNWQKSLCALCVSGNRTRFEIMLLLNVHWILCMFSLSVIKLPQELHIKFWIDETWNSIEHTHVINWIKHRFAIDMNVGPCNKSTNFVASIGISMRCYAYCVRANISDLISNHLSSKQSENRTKTEFKKKKRSRIG